MRTILFFVLNLLFSMSVFAQANNNPDTKIRVKVGDIYSSTVGQNNLVALNEPFSFNLVIGGEGAEQRLEYADVIVSWDPTKFEYVSSFPALDARISQTTPTLSPSSVANGVNDSLTDGNAMFRIQKSATWNGTYPAYQCIALAASEYTNGWGNSMHKINMKCISNFIQQTTQIQILPSIQIPGYPTAFTKVYGYLNPATDVTGGLVNRTVTGSTANTWKLDLSCIAPETQVGLGDSISIPLQVSPQTFAQRYVVADIAFTWNPNHLRLTGIDLVNNNPNVWDGASGFPGANNEPDSVCCDLSGTNEVIPPQDGTGLLFIYGFLGGNFMVTQPETLVNLNFDVVGLFNTTQVTTVSQLQGLIGTQKTEIYGSNTPGMKVTGNHYAAVITGSTRLGDFNNNGSVGSEDLSVLLSSWGQVSFGNNPVDLNGNGVVDAPDLSILVSNWG